MKGVFAKILILIPLIIFSQKKIEGKYDSEKNIYIQKNQDFWISEFTNGAAKISKNGFYGIIDQNGKAILPIIYDEIFLTTDGIFAKKDFSKFAFNYDGSNNCSCFFGAHSNRDSYQQYPEYKILNFDYYGKSFSEDLFLSKIYYNSKTNKYQLTYLDKIGNVKISTDKYSDGLIFSEGLAGVSSFKYWGFIDKTGKEVISPRYDYQSSFREGVANVSKNGKYGLIDKNENIIIPFEFDLMSSVFDGAVSVKKDNKYGFFDTKGKMIIDFIYDDALFFQNGLANVKKDGKWLSINKKGDVENYFQFLYDDGYRFMDYDGKKVYEDKLGNVIFRNTFSAEYFREGLAKIKQDGKYGFIDRLGNIIIAPIYDSAEEFKNGLTRIGIGKDYFYINKKGEKVIQSDPVLRPDFNLKGINISQQKDNTYNLKNCETGKIIAKKLNSVSVHDNLIIVTLNNEKQLYDFTGKKALPNTYQEIIIKENRVISQNKKEINIYDINLRLDKKINTDADLTLYDEPMSSDAVLIKQNNKIGLINIVNGKMISPRFDSVSFLKKAGLFIGKYSTENYIIDVKKNIATLFNFSSYDEFSKGILKTSKYGKNQGLIDSEGNILLPLEYEISFLSNNTTIIKKNNLYGMIDENARILLNPNYQKISNSDGSYMDGNDELILVKSNNKAGFVDRKGNLKIDFQYEDAIPFNNKLAPVKINGKWGYIDKFNTTIIDPIYDEAWPFIDTSQARAKIGNQSIIIDRQGNKIRNAEN